MTDSKHHYFAASQECFTTDLDLENIVNKMKLEGCDFVVWLVPLPLFSDYAVVLYEPQVLGARALSKWTCKKKANDDRLLAALEKGRWSNAPYTPSN